MKDTPVNLLIPFLSPSLVLHLDVSFLPLSTNAVNPTSNTLVLSFAQLRNKHHTLFPSGFLPGVGIAFVITLRPAALEQMRLGYI
jgi:hypothetical protein